MPQVPAQPGFLQESALPQISENPNAASITSFGGAQGVNPYEAISGLGQAAERIGEAEKKRADDTQTQIGQGKIITLKNKMLYGDAETPGLLMKKGQDAFGILDQGQEIWSKGVQNIRDSLSNDDQKLMLDKIANHYWNESSTEMNRHMATQVQQVRKDTFDAGVQVNRDDAIQNYQIPGKIEESLGVQRTLLLDHAQDLGIKPGSDEFRALDLDIKSKTHAGIVERMMNNGQDLEAKKYFEDNRDEFSGPDLLKVEKVVEEGSARGESQRIVDGILSRDLSSQDALSEIRGIENPKVRDEAYSRYKNEIETQKALTRDQQEKQYEAVSQIVEQTKSRDSIPIEQWLSLAPAERSAVDSRIKQLNSDIQPPANSETFYTLRTMAATPELQDDFRKENLLTYKGKVTDPELRNLIDLQTSLRKGDGKADPLLNGYRSSQEIVNDTLKSLSINPNAKAGTSAAKNVNRFRQMVDEQINLKQAETGKKVSTQDVQDISDMLATKIVKDRGFLFDSHARLFELDRNTPFQIDASEIPRGERIKIEDALRSRNLPVNDKTVTDLYLRKLQGVVNAP